MYQQQQQPLQTRSHRGAGDAHGSPRLCGGCDRIVFGKERALGSATSGGRGRRGARDAPRSRCGLRVRGALAGPAAAPPAGPAVTATALMALLFPQRARTLSHPPHTPLAFSLECSCRQAGDAAPSWGRPRVTPLPLSLVTEP